MSEENNIALIDRYLSEELEGKELEKFEERLSNDADLKNDVNFIKDVSSSLGRLSMKESLNLFESEFSLDTNDTNNSNDTNTYDSTNAVKKSIFKTKGFIISGVVVTSAIVFISYNYFKSNEKKIDHQIDSPIPIIDTLKEDKIDYESCFFNLLTDDTSSLYAGVINEIKITTDLGCDVKPILIKTERGIIRRIDESTWELGIHKRDFGKNNLIKLYYDTTLLAEKNYKIINISEDSIKIIFPPHFNLKVNNWDTTFLYYEKNVMK